MTRKRVLIHGKETSKAKAEKAVKSLKERGWKNVRYRKCNPWVGIDGKIHKGYAVVSDMIRGEKTLKRRKK